MSVELLHWTWPGVECQVESWCGRADDHFHGPEGQIYETVAEFEEVSVIPAAGYTIENFGLDGVTFRLAEAISRNASVELPEYRAVPQGMMSSDGEPMAQVSFDYYVRYDEPLRPLLKMSYAAIFNPGTNCEFDVKTADTDGEPITIWFKIMRLGDQRIMQNWARGGRGLPIDGWVQIGRWTVA